ncbi:nuclease-related domain-containing protein [Synechococcus sp. PCC 6312]|uniref:nuclease-related domain-containing protein n=1 Tax=Synechococcus sp. (strain ATCC 27167 / PCC 6312) TaxID=195253 RepID=UPI00029F2F8D|nr:hypothetical protein [Synechococcus sp. PCC 6312]AFY60727.1 hypothetical protein Syn6312_1565 [Synechococcus sp. PCC 6312]
MATTSAEVWQLLGELVEAQRQTERECQATRRILKEQSQETERLMQKQSEITDQKIQAVSQEVRAVSQQIKNVNQQISFGGHRFGEFPESQVRLGVVPLLRARVISNLWVQRGRNESEIDLFVINGSDVIVVEVKIKLTQADADDHLERLQTFKPLMPKYNDKRALGAVAGMVIAQDVDPYDYRKGLFVLALSGAQGEILNDDKFQPQAW